MSSIDRNISVIGYACRLPQAADADQFWDILANDRCVITEVAPDRWATERFGHPDPATMGKTYTWAAGQIDNIWNFDPGFFGISPREAIQMDPQQRLLLEVVWEALEHAGVTPSSLAGSKTGVYIGASSVDYSNRFMLDPSAADVQVMTGNTLSIISNRISYIYDLHGPSFTVDTACSSSLVAMHEAHRAINSGEIDTAIVGGVSLLLSPFAFTGFSRASMLSPAGLCKAFDASGDGYVRSEGAVIMVLRAGSAAADNGDTAHAVIPGTGINSDGRTVGMSLPSSQSQADLLRDVYDQFGINANQLAFIEAHGTGTRVGDPAEAFALGETLGQKRDDVLPIGSVKTNFGHLEPASGLVGVLKSILALRNDLLPASLHFDTPNPDIPFEELNLSVASSQLKLARNGGHRYAGINSFGFGGANAHVIVRDPDPAKQPPKPLGMSGAPLIVSAQSKQALAELVEEYIALIGGIDEGTCATVVNSAAHTRDRLTHRLVAFGRTRAELLESLDQASETKKLPTVSRGQSIGRDLPVAFLFSGNGSQWAGMGRDAYQSNRVFQKAFDTVDRQFMRFAGWSMLTTLFSPELDGELERTEVAQPLLFALQVSLVEALADQGIAPAAVAGHSVGEVAAAWACGALSLKDAVQVIHARSTHQEITRHLGGMAALLLPADKAREAIDYPAFAGIELAAVNSPRSVTISGPIEKLEAFAAHARKQRWAMRQLDLAYPFHCALVEPIKQPLLDTLSGLSPTKPQVPFYSTVDIDDDAGPYLDRDYWWRNVRQPVHFQDALQRMAKDGSRVFLEIGPRPVLATYGRDTLRTDDIQGIIVASLDKTAGESVDPIARIAADILVAGGAVEINRFVGRRHQARHTLPRYPWQKLPYQVEQTGEGLQYYTPNPHKLLGYRVRNDVCEWFNHIDTRLLPWLTDHRIEETAIFPAAGYIEMALSAGREWLKTDAVEIRDFDIFRPMVFDDDQTLETLVRISPDSLGFEILSRSRLVDDDWSLHVRGRLAKAINKPPPRGEPVQTAAADIDHDALYHITEEFGLNYGPAFRRVDHVKPVDDKTAHLALRPIEDGFDDLSRYSMHPTILDAGFHGLFALVPENQRANGRISFLPVRIGRMVIHGDASRSVSCDLTVTRASAHSIEASFIYRDIEGYCLAEITGARFRAVPLSKSERPDELIYRTTWTLLPQNSQPQAAGDKLGSWLEQVFSGDAVTNEPAPLDEDWLLMEAVIRPIAMNALKSSMDQAGGRVTLADLVAKGSLATSALPLMTRLLQSLEDVDLVTDNDGVWSLNNGDAGPADPEEILRTLVADYPLRIAETTALTRLNVVLADILRDGLPNSLSDVFTRDLIAQFNADTPTINPLEDCLVQSISQLIDDWRENVPLRVLIIGAPNRSFIRRISDLIDRRFGSLTVADVESGTVESARLSITGDTHIGWATLAELCEPAAADAGFDLVLSLNSLHRIAAGAGTLQQLAQISAAGARLLAAEPAPVLLHDVIFGLAGDWWGGTADPEFPIGLYRTAQEWSDDLEHSGLFTDVTIAALNASSTEATLLSAKLVRSIDEDAVDDGEDGGTEADEEIVDQRQILIVTGAKDRETALAEAMRSDIDAEVHVGALSITIANDVPVVICAVDGRDPVMLADLTEKTSDLEILYLHDAWMDESDPGSAILARTTMLTAVLNSVGTNIKRLWVIAPGAVQSHIGGHIHRPAQTAVWGFTRVAMNEFPDTEIRLIDITPNLAPGEAAGRLVPEINHPSDERELVINADRRAGLRLAAGGILPDLEDIAAGPDVDGYRLDIVNQGSLDGIAWHNAQVSTPAPGQVQIEVAATGLNFRDVMWALGMLPDEALEDGFAGPTLGMECAGTIVAIGDGVERLKLGDRVLAFAPACFASHVTVAEFGCAPVPQSVSLTEAATLPVTFLTAYYALVQLANLDDTDTVLIHGGAGGVGLAALQIAKWRGATVFATAGSKEKRDLLRTLGADHVLDSRSLTFADEIRGITNGAGVDVVLNSLFGDAMERSIELLKPFGRFLELGKRDYYANTLIGLRPFRQNLSYFGIDADQLLVHQPKLAEKIFRKLVALFEAGILSPLPHRVFHAEAVTDAFRLMQQSGHIGKIVVTPPETKESAVAAEIPIARADGSYLIVGGLGGFGLRTAQWLVDHGARNLMLVGRRGIADDATQAVLNTIEEGGVTVRTAAIDVSAAEKVTALFEDMAATMPPIRGILHTAMVLDDGLIMNMDGSRIETVLRPKVQGAHNLDRASRGLELDFFVLFSSATTLVGNPGQSNYVAANAYLEGLARQRRAEGLPALAISWGAIGDAGYLTRNSDTNQILSARLGRHTLKAKDALEGMSLLLRHGGNTVHDAAVGYARIDWAAARKELAIVKSALYSDFLGDMDDDMGDGEGQIDLDALLKGMDRAGAVETIAKLLSSEIAKILRMPADEIERHRPLTEVGMDSLMALELRMSAEKRLGIDIPLMSLANGATMNDIANRIVARHLDSSGQEEISADSELLADQHMTEDRATYIDAKEIAAKVESRSAEIRNLLK